MPTRKHGALLAVILILSSALPAMADEPCRQSWPLVTDQPSPCTGILWPEAWSRAALRCFQIDVVKVKREMEYRLQVMAADLDACTTTLSAARTALDACEASISEVISPPSAWWRHPALWAAVGLVVGVAGTVTVWQLVE